MHLCWTNERNVIQGIIIRDLLVEILWYLYIVIIVWINIRWLWLLHYLFE